MVFLTTLAADDGYAGATVTTVGELLAALDAVAPLSKAGGWDPVGLQLGDAEGSARRVAVCHEITGAVVDRLVAESVDLAIVYHPLLFRPTTRLVAGSGPAGRAYRLLRAGVAVAVVHTAYDVAAGGAADALADALGLSGVTGFGPNWGPESVSVVSYVPAADTDAVAAAMAAAGAGVIGNYRGCSYRSDGTGTFLPGVGANPHVGDSGVLNREPETRLEMVAPRGRLDAVVAALVASHPYEEPAYNVFDHKGNAGLIGRRGARETTVGELADAAADVLGGVVRVAGERSRPVATVAAIPGSGGSFVAAAAGSDVLVTGDIGHHTARQALDLGMAVIDPGHGPTERPGVARLYAAVAAVVKDPVDLTQTDPDPWGP